MRPMNADPLGGGKGTFVFNASRNRLLLSFLLACTALAAAEKSISPQARQLHQDSIVIDGHNDVTTWIVDCGFDLGMDGADPRKKNAELWWILGRFLPTPAGDELRTHTDLRRMIAGGLDAQFLSIFSDPRRFSGAEEAKGRALDMIEAVRRQVELHADRLELALGPDEIREASARGRIAILMGLEGGHAIANDLATLDLFYDLGVRYMTLTWSNTNDWADSSTDEQRHGGLTQFGREVIREMNRLGMIVDVSHASDDTFWDVVATTGAPIIASHSSARALVDVPRNMSDEMLRAVAASGGVVMVNFGGAFIDPRKAGTWNMLWDALLHLGPSSTPLSALLDHIDHVVHVAGVDSVGLGSDFDGTLFLPDEARDVAGFPAITAGLLERGHSAEDIRKILGENLLRAFGETEAVAAHLRMASTAQQGSLYVLSPDVSRGSLRAHLRCPGRGSPHGRGTPPDQGPGEQSTVGTLTRPAELPISGQRLDETGQSAMKFP